MKKRWNDKIQGIFLPHFFIERFQAGDTVWNKHLNIVTFSYKRRSILSGMPKTHKKADKNADQGRSFSVVQSNYILSPYRCFGVISFLSSLNSFWKATMNDLQNWRIQNQFIWLHRLQRIYHVFLSDFLGRQNGKPLSLLPIQRHQSVFAGNPIPEVYLMIPWIFTYNSIYVLSMTS